MSRIRSIAVLPIALFAMGAQAQVGPTAPAPMPSITAQGTADIYTAPDLATIRIGVESTGKTAAEAQNQTNILANRIIAAALKVVGERKNIQTSELSLYPEYTQPVAGQRPKIAGYRARNVLTIRVEKVANVGALLDATTAAGATNVDSISFGLKDEKPSRLIALRDAVREARAKAEAMAEGLGMKLGEVISIEEGGGPVVRPFETRAYAMKADSAPVEAGEVSVSASVVVRFRLIK